jgi:3-dehydroquinate dehydratase-1
MRATTIAMRPESDIQIPIRDKLIGGPTVMICVPLMAAHADALLDQVQTVKPLAPDLLEWRIDGFDGVGDLDTCLDVLAALRSEIGELPLILTCRLEAEGGQKALDAETRLRLLRAAIASGHIDLVDVELHNGDAFIQSVREAARRHNTRLMLSHHNFDATPRAAALIQTLAHARKLGADIAKLAVMPQSPLDVLTLLTATLHARTQENLQIPLVTMAMGSLGRITRIAGGMFGSDITFAAGETSTAPGQIHISDLKHVMAALYG